MTLGWGAWKASLVLAGCLTLTLPVIHAQNSSVANSAEAARASLAANARALESRGRPDMAAQLWQQILLSTPGNAEALAGLARDYKLMGSFDKADQTLDRLRKLNPNDPNIARIEAMPTANGADAELRHAGELARQGKNDDAMRIYRQLYGDHPPDGDIGLAYYQTLYATASGKQAAIVGMRAMADRNPGDMRYPIQLGIMLTYSAGSRAEGMRILRNYPRDPVAEAGLRQALIWDSANPASAAERRENLKTHPQDVEIQKGLEHSKANPAQMNSGIARTPEERAAFAALNTHRLDEAEQRFTALLHEEPNNPRVQAGMGFLRMQQKNFGGAVSYLTQAEQNGYNVKIVETALAASRFWLTMSEATQALDANQLDLAAARFRAAIGMNPHSSDALNGLAGVYTKQQKYSAAATAYEQLLRIQPGSPDGWRGLFFAYALNKQNDKALAVSARFPASVKASLNKDPEYLHALAGIYQVQGRTAEAERLLALALSLPFPANDSALLVGVRLQYAGLLMDAKQYDRALALYSQILSADPNDVPAWMGLIGAQHELGQDTQAIAAVEKMPAASYETALADPGFLSTLAAIYQQANQYEVAQDFLERSEKLARESGRQPSVALQLQLAAIYLVRNNTDQAYAIYRQVLADHPDRADAWKGLINTLTSTNRNAQALQEIAQIPVPVRKQLDGDIEFLQAEAGAYAATGDTANAVQSMGRVQAYYAKIKQLPPPGIDVQNAWLLYDTGNDRALYAALMRIGGRNDLTVEQREMVQDIWANWSVRRAAAAIDNGNAQHAIDILDAASQAFPNNMTVRMAVAGGYALVGRAKESLALFKTVPMQSASAGDLEAAAGAALAANDKNQAEIWVRQALERFPTDPAVLSLAARYEQARGDNERAAEYYRASIAAMPKTSPVDRLAHVLAYPEQNTKAHRAVTAADLQHLLDPDYEPFAKTIRLRPLPPYGPDPYNPPPVVLPQPQPTQPPPQAPDAATTGPGALNSPGREPGFEREGPQSCHEERKIIGAMVSPSNASGKQEVSGHDRGTHPVGGSRAKGDSKTKGALAPARYFLRQDASYRTRRSNTGARMILASWSPMWTRASTRYTPIRAAIQSSVEAFPQIDIVPNPPHSMASDNWKGLVFSLMAANRNAEALSEMGKIPPDVRRLLEADIEWVQGVASLYFAVGDTEHGTVYLNRVESYYAIHRASAPAGLELQHALLLYNLRDSIALYPLLLRLDARQDLTADQRRQIDNLWADWAVRRAADEMDRGQLLRGVEILQAASQDYPDNLTVRFAVAAAYARVGRAQEALALFKSIPMNDASQANFQGAISAAIAAKDMAQAEAWLRTALARYPNDPIILAQAARFEQARGNKQRASAFWRAAIAAAPPGSTVKSLDYGLVNPPGTYRTPAPGDTKKLLDPRADPGFASPATPEMLAPLPSYRSQSSTQDYQPASGGASSAQVSSSQSQLTGRMNLPPAEQTIASVDVATGTVNARLPPQEPTNTPAQTSTSTPPADLRIESEPMDAAAAQAQAQFAAQTDSQLTEGSAAHIHNLPNAPVGQPPAVQTSPTTSSSSESTYNVAQHTPSAQEAGTGAYSAPQQPQATPQPPPTKPANSANTAQKKKKRPQQKQQPSQIPGNAPIVSNPPPENPPSHNPPPTPAAETAPPQAQEPIPAPQQSPSESTSGTGLSDQELEQRNLPPLRGPWVRVQREGNPLSPRDEAEMQLRAIESGYSGWLGGSTVFNYRSGDPGYSQLAAIESPFEASAPLGYNARITAIARPVFLDSNQANGTATLPVDEFQSGTSCLVAIPEPIGTHTASQNSTPCTAPSIGTLTPPAQQNSFGLGGELQLAFPHLAIAGGYTPFNFLVSTFTGRFMWKPGPFTFSLVRDSEKDSQLSYAGLRDPGQATLSSPGQIWGGVVYNQGNVQFARNAAESGFYFSAGGQYLTGSNVLSNSRIDGNGGAYWRVVTSPEYGNLSVGADFFAMHYANNQNAFTHGLGGYFSPQSYFLANVPFTWQGHYQTAASGWHYSIIGALGVRAIQEDSAPLWPLAADKQLETNQNNPMLPNVTSVGGNYDLRSQVGYEVGPHWFVGAYLSANNTRDYNYASVGFFVRFMFREQPSTATAPTGLFPWDGLRPFTVP